MCLEYIKCEKKYKFVILIINFNAINRVKSKLKYEELKTKTV